MQLQINDKMRALLVKDFAEALLLPANKKVVVVFSKDTDRTSANNGDLTNSSLDSVYDSSTITPIYAKNLSDDASTEIKIGGLKSKLVTLEDSEEVTIGGVVYLFVDYEYFLTNFSAKYSNKNVTSIYIGNPEVIVTNSQVYNAMSILLTTDVAMTTKDFTTGSPTATPLDADKTKLIAQVLPADAWMPDSNADNKELKVVINL